jgi:AhpC/TSA family/Thiol:disulfide interchange protein DsbD, N-terminal
VELQRRVEELRRDGLGLAAISYDSPEVLAGFAERRGVTFPLLSDRDSTTIRGYGILNTTVDAGSKAAGIPFPGTFVLDHSGRVRARFFEETYRQRYTTSNILLRLGQDLDRPATATGTSHLELRTWTTDDLLAPGWHSTLVMDVTPKPGMHVYAPGAKGYRVISLTLEPNPHVRLDPVEYPPSETYYFAPLDETVPVYEHSFRLTAGVLVDASRESQEALKDQRSLTLDGTVEYQACDDRVCYNPETVPVTWRFELRPLDRP